MQLYFSTCLMMAKESLSVIKFEEAFKSIKRKEMFKKSFEEISKIFEKSL